jgi:hypothetical protein
MLVTFSSGDDVHPFYYAPKVGGAPVSHPDGTETILLYMRVVNLFLVFYQYYILVQVAIHLFPCVIGF